MTSSQTLKTGTGDEVYKTLLTPGDGPRPPTDGWKCTVTTTVVSVPNTACGSFMTSGKVSNMSNGDCDTNTVTLGDYDTYFGQALDLLLPTMKQGEKSQLKIPWKPWEYAFEPLENPPKPPNFVVDVELLLVTEPATEIWKLSPEVKLAQAAKLKKQGNPLHQKAHNDLAFTKYCRGLKLLLSIGEEADVPEGILPEVRTLKCQLHLNIAACLVNASNFPAAIQNCTDALGLEPSNVKALYRRGKSYIRLHSWELAKQDLEAAASLDPQNKAVKHNLSYAKEVLRKQDSHMAEAMSKMFS